MSEAVTIITPDGAQGEGQPGPDRSLIQAHLMERFPMFQTPPAPPEQENLQHRLQDLDKLSNFDLTRLTATALGYYDLERRGEPTQYTANLWGRRSDPTSRVQTQSAPMQIKVSDFAREEFCCKQAKDLLTTQKDLSIGILDTPYEVVVMFVDCETKKPIVATISQDVEYPRAFCKAVIRAYHLGLDTRIYELPLGRPR